MANRTNIKPLHDYVLIRPQKADTKTASGIILPENVKEKPQMGTVMAVGAGWHNNDGQTFPLAVKVGQLVIYTKWGGNEVKVEHEEWKLVKESDILAIAE
ncbi:MAG: co-chaperone GroES [Patescibacteria group bacterium]